MEKQYEKGRSCRVKHHCHATSIITTLQFVVESFPPGPGAVPTKVRVVIMIGGGAPVGLRTMVEGFGTGRAGGA